MGPIKSLHLESLERDGFVVISSILAPSELTTLRDACQATTTLARAGKWPNVRTLPKQFPPWIVPAGSNPAVDGIWGVQGLMNPALPAHDMFIANYFSSAVMGIAKELLSCTDDDLVMELFNLLVRPDRDFELRWHRDDISTDATAEEEVERLSKPAWHAQWNLCLYDDASLIAVPGSHLRARTDEERNADLFEPNMPGQVIVKLKAGDAVFYNNNILHRGAYDSKVERMTLHGSVGHVKGSNLRARNVLQHGVRDFINEITFNHLGDNERIRAEGMRKRLVELGMQAGDVGFSLAE